MENSYNAHRAAVFSILFFVNVKPPIVDFLSGVFDGCLAVTYFRERVLTIIGAHLFHGPVREGKGWVQKAIAAKRNLSARRLNGVERKMGIEGCLL